MNVIKPATVGGPVSGSNVRVVYDDEVVVVVASANTTTLVRTDDEIVASSPTKTKIETTEGTLSVVRQGGCSCGKAWLTRPSSTELLTTARQSVAV